MVLVGRVNKQIVNGLAASVAGWWVERRRWRPGGGPHPGDGSLGLVGDGAVDPSVIIPLLDQGHPGDPELAPNQRASRTTSMPIPSPANWPRRWMPKS